MARKFEQTDRRFETMENRFAQVDGRLRRIEDGVLTNDRGIRELRTTMARMESTLTTKVDRAELEPIVKGMLGGR